MLYVIHFTVSRIRHKRLSKIKQISNDLHEYGELSAYDFPKKTIGTSPSDTESNYTRATEEESDEMEMEIKSPNNSAVAMDIRAFCSDTKLPYSSHTTTPPTATSHTNTTANSPTTATTTNPTVIATTTTNSATHRSLMLPSLFLSPDSASSSYRNKQR